MFYIYKTTNKVNGKYYIGKHKGFIEDSYLGSGILIRQAIEKYGKNNFEKEELVFCRTEEEANYWETRIISLNIKNPDCYNLAPGGEGGFTTKYFSAKDKKEISKKASQSFKRYRKENPEEVEQWQKKQRITLMKNIDKHKQSIKTSLAKRTKEEVEEQHAKITNRKLQKGIYSIFKLIDTDNITVMESIGAENIGKKYKVSANGIRLAAKHGKPIKRGNLAGYRVEKVLAEHTA